MSEAPTIYGSLAVGGEVVPARGVEVADIGRGSDKDDGGQGFLFLALCCQFFFNLAHEPQV